MPVIKTFVSTIQNTANDRIQQEPMVFLGEGVRYTTTHNRFIVPTISYNFLVFRKLITKIISTLLLMKPIIFFSTQAQRGLANLTECAAQVIK